jgi:hypothetical protein
MRPHLRPHILRMPMIYGLFTHLKCEGNVITNLRIGRLGGIGSMGSLCLLIKSVGEGGGGGSYGYKWVEVCRCKIHGYKLPSKFA